MNNIKKYRTAKGMKQIELCKILGVSQGALSGWENGRYEPDIKSLNTMAQLFEITVDELLGNNLSNTNTDAPLTFDNIFPPAPIQEAYDKASPAIQEAVRKLLDIE